MGKLTAKCVYRNCYRGCLSKTHHRAIYASMTQQDFTEHTTKYKKSPKINYEKLRELLEEESLSKEKLKK